MPGELIFSQSGINFEIYRFIAIKLVWIKQLFLQCVPRDFAF